MVPSSKIIIIWRHDDDEDDDDDHDDDDDDDEDEDEDDDGMSLWMSLGYPANLIHCINQS